MSQAGKYLSRRHVLGAAIGLAGAAVSGRASQAAGQRWAKVYETDFVREFSVNDTGRDAGGKPCWLSRFRYGRIVNNGEVGLYADPDLFTATDPFPVVAGKRRLRSERLVTPLAWKGVDYAYSAALMTSPRGVVIGPGNRVECRMALPHVMRKGYWPAFWLLPDDNSWPPEIDVMEWWLHNEGDRKDAFWNSLHTGTVTRHENDAKAISLASFGIAGDMTQFLTYAVEITPVDIICFVEGREVSRRANPAPRKRWHIVLNLAVAGDPWPGAPDADTRFPQEVILDRLTVLKRG